MKPTGQLEYFRSGIDGAEVPCAVCATDTSDEPKPLIIEVSPGAMKDLPGCVSEVENMASVAVNHGGNGILGTVRNFDQHTEHYHIEDADTSADLHGAPAGAVAIGRPGLGLAEAAARDPSCSPTAWRRCEGRPLWTSISLARPPLPSCHPRSPLATRPVMARSTEPIRQLRVMAPRFRPPHAVRWPSVTMFSCWESPPMSQLFNLA